MAKPITSIPLFVLSVFPLALVACGQSVTDLDSRDDISGRLVNSNNEADEDAGAMSEPIVEEVTSNSDAGASEFVDLRPAKPERGVVVGGADDFSETNCCSRVTGAPINQSCPPGQGKTAFGTLADATDKLQAPETPAGVGVRFEISPVRPLGEPVEFVVEETTIDPPSGIVDLSPVYWVWTVEQEDIPLFVRLPISSGGLAIEPDAVHIFFSADGSEFNQLADDNLNAGFLQGTLTGTGFLVAGAADPAGVQCF